MVGEREQSRAARHLGDAVPEDDIIHSSVIAFCGERRVAIRRRGQLGMIHLKISYIYTLREMPPAASRRSPWLAMVVKSETRTDLYDQMTPLSCSRAVTRSLHNLIFRLLL